MKMKYKVFAMLTIMWTTMVPASFWMYGFDFDQRGTDLGACFIMTVTMIFFSALICIPYPEQ